MAKQGTMELDLEYGKTLPRGTLGREHYEAYESLRKTIEKIKEKLPLPAKFLLKIIMFLQSIKRNFFNRA